MKRNVTKLFSIGLLCLSLNAFGQEKPITGKVVDSNGFPVQDAYVYIDGKDKGVYTDAEGKYTLDAKKGDVIKIEFIGFDSKSITVSDKDNYFTKMIKGKNEVNLIDIVVLGYGSARDVASTASSVAVVSGDKVDNKPSANALDALQGQVAGLQIYTSTGEPSGVSSVRLHGVGSFGASTAPLFILDGIQVSSDIFSVINSQDIENVSVLKDAAATSIYGSRAANGVIYITTKRGKKGEGTFTIGAQQGFSSLASTEFFDKAMNTEELLNFWQESGLKTVEQVENIRRNFGGNDTNWRKYYLKEYAPTMQVNASFSGGVDRTSYYVSGAYFDQEGLAYRSNIKKYNLRANVDTGVKDWLKIGANTSLNYNRNSANPYTFNSLNFGLFYVAQPFYTPYKPNGEEYYDQLIPGWNLYSPRYLADKKTGVRRNLEVTPTGYIEITPNKDLTLRTQGGIQFWLGKQSYHTLPSFEGLNNGRAEEDITYDIRKTLTNTIEYKLNLAERHNLILLAGHEYVDYLYERVEATSSGQTNDQLTMLGQGTKDKNVGQVKYENTYVSLFGRLEYDFNKKYYLNASLRRDGSSRFGEKNKHANFWSVGLMWKAKKEDFLSDVNWLSELTFKASTGTSGNSDIGNYESLALVGTRQYEGKTGYVITNPGNPSLTWEQQNLTTLTANIGFFDRVNLELSVYDRQTKNLLYDVPTAYTTGFSDVKKNVGTVENRGVDVKVDAAIVKSKDYYLNVYANFNYNANKVTSLFQNREYWVVPEFGEGYAVGEPITFLYPIAKGVNPETGYKEWYLPNEENVFKTQMDDSKVTTKFSETLTQSTGKPRYAPTTGGFGLSAGYKGFSLNADFAFAIDKYLINNDRFFLENPVVFPAFNTSKVVVDYWKEAGNKAKYPGINKGQNFTDFDTDILENASFMRLKNITLGYSLPSHVMDKISFLKNVRVYMTGRNLLTFTKYTGPDPEVDSNIVLGENPNTKQYVFGVEIKF